MMTWNKININNYVRDIEYKHQMESVPYYGPYYGYSNYGVAQSFTTRIEHTYKIYEADLKRLLHDSNEIALFQSLREMGWLMVKYGPVKTKGEEDWIYHQIENGAGNIREFTLPDSTIKYIHYIGFEKAETATLHQLTWR